MSQQSLRWRKNLMLRINSPAWKSEDRRASLYASIEYNHPDRKEKKFLAFVEKARKVIPPQSFIHFLNYKDWIRVCHEDFYFHKGPSAGLKLSSMVLCRSKGFVQSTKSVTFSEQTLLYITDYRCKSISSTCCTLWSLASKSNDIAQPTGPNQLIFIHLGRTTFYENNEISFCG
jgi:hypothetical protein